MALSRRAGALAAVALTALGVAGYVWLDEPESAPAPTTSEVVPQPAPARTRTARPARPRAPGPEDEPPAPDARPRHTLDPCRPRRASRVPDGFEQLEAQGITVAWSGEQPVAEPTALAYLAAGLLEEAGQRLGAMRRDDLAVVVYPSLAELRAQAGVPPWARGMYDGTVRLAAEPEADHGVTTRTLRHELMHAQLHEAVGCAPVWLNEGLASWFGGTAPRRAWLRMLRGARLVDVAALAAPTVEDVPSDDVDLIYAQSLAMALYTMDRSPQGLMSALLDLRAANGRAASLALWSRLHPGATSDDVLDYLAERVFGEPRGPALDAILAGTVCCHAESQVDHFGCRSPLAAHAGARCKPD